VPAPTVVNVGAASSSANAITPAFPASIVADDILIGVGESVGGSNFPNIATNGFAHIDSVSPVVQGVNTQLSVVWRRYDGVVTAHSWGDSGDHNIGRYIAIRGCPTAGNPWDVVAAAVEATSDTSVSWPGATTTVVDTLVLEIIATDTDVSSTTNLGTLTNASYTSITERMDNWIISGNGGGIGMVSGIKASAGATGASTATLANAGNKALMTLALKPATVVDSRPSGYRAPRMRPASRLAGASYSR
jgi:hypothetical protein